MKKIFLFTFIALALCTPLFANDDPFADPRKSLKYQTFVVETDKDSSAESLDRISGKYDLGFSTPDQEYDSSDHYQAGPFGRQDAQDKTRQSY